MIPKRIRSYVLRAGRISPRQQQALESWLPDYALSREEPWCLETIFGRRAKTVVEIGFGMGSSLLSMALSHPEINFVGIEVHRAGIGALVACLHEQAITNVRIAAFDAVEVFSTHLSDDSVDGVQLFFPDPWPKARHHKRRLIQPEFVARLVKKIKPGGFLHCATDWENYAHHMLFVLSSQDELINQAQDGQFVPRPATRPLTKFEQRGNQLGHGTWDLIYNKA